MNDLPFICCQCNANNQYIHDGRLNTSHCAERETDETNEKEVYTTNSMVKGLNIPHATVTVKGPSNGNPSTEYCLENTTEETNEKSTAMTDQPMVKGPTLVKDQEKETTPANSGHLLGVVQNSLPDKTISCMGKTENQSQNKGNAGTKQIPPSTPLTHLNTVTPVSGLPQTGTQKQTKTRKKAENDQKQYT